MGKCTVPPTAFKMPYGRRRASESISQPTPLFPRIARPPEREKRRERRSRSGAARPRSLALGRVGDDASPSPMAATLETLTLTALVALYFLLTAAELFLRVRRARRSRQRRRQQEQVKEEVIPPPRETPAGPDSVVEEEEPAGDGEREKQPQRRRRRARRKRQQEGEGGGAGDATPAAAPPAKEKAAGKGEPPLLPRRPQFPLASVAGALQRRINERYDDLARASEAKCLTIEQVNEFINCLKDARNELLQRYENVQRSFKIKKAMLSNHQNYRSSHGRLFEQVCRLEIERDNLKKDAAIYNSLQERLQASAPYKLIMELSAMEMEAPEISFEELLAQEKEDTAFWQKMRSVSSK